MILLEKNQVTIEPSELADVVILKGNLRYADIREIWRGTRLRPEEALLRGYVDSKPCLTMKRRGVPIAMFGVIENQDNPSVGTIWLLGSGDIRKIGKTFIRISREVIRAYFMKYEVLTNAVDSENKVAIEWLKHLGAMVTDTLPYGPEGEPFHLFQFKRGDL